ncbi:hypothetical protein ABPG74_019804 [Tetrahymena malaccensis]
MKLILLLSIVCICFAQINLRRDQQSQLLANTCQNPCAKHINDVLPGMSLGQKVANLQNPFQIFASSIADGSNVINYCCDKHKTNKLIRKIFGRKFIIPDFVDVSESNLKDILTINATISNITKDENQTSRYKIKINHLFQRRALNLSTDINQITLNMTAVNIKDLIFERPNLNLYECQETSNNWRSWIFFQNRLGQDLMYQQVIGTFMNATVVFYSNQTYTQEQITSTYWKFIQSNQFDRIDKAFKNIHLTDHTVISEGGVNFMNYSWHQYLSQLGPQNYVFVSSRIPGYENEQLQKNFDSYEIFNSYPKQVQECAKKLWDYSQQHQGFSQI